MSNIRRHHPILHAQLLASIEHCDGQQLRSDLLQLSNADFRCASVILGEDLLPLFPDNFWALFLAVVPTHPKAYLGTFLKAAVIISQRDHTFIASHMNDVCTFIKHHASPIDVRKSMEALLPCLDTPKNVGEILSFASGSTENEKILWLLKAGTFPCSFVLLKQLEAIDAKADVVRQCCLALMKKGDTYSFNLACMLQTFFGLPQLPGTFSLKLQPYELARMSVSYEHFLKILNGHPINE